MRRSYGDAYDYTYGNIYTYGDSNGNVDTYGYSHGDSDTYRHSNTVGGLPTNPGLLEKSFQCLASK